MMDNSWNIGWEAISAITGVFSFILVVFIEQDKLSENLALLNALFFLAMVACGASIGFLISQTPLWSRMIGLMLTALLGAFFGAMYYDEQVYKGRMTIHLFGAIIGLLVGLWVANRF